MNMNDDITRINFQDNKNNKKQNKHKRSDSFTDNHMPIYKEIQANDSDMKLRDDY